jgi:bifunctional non-homologous end joining protein LigD
MTIPAAGRTGRVVMEVSTPCAAPFDGDEWLFNVDWEGSRCLLVADANGAIRLQGENGLLDDRFPEIMAAAGSIAGRGAVLEGSVCVLDGQGRPDLSALSRRLIAGSALPPAVYLVTDILHLDGAPMGARPLVERLAALAQLIPRDSRIQLPDHVAGHGRALAEAATERGLSAVMARRRDARYLAGMASPLRLRIALTGRRDAVIVGWRSSANGVRLLLGDWVLGRLGLIGVTSVEDRAARRWLVASAEAVPAIAVDDSDAAGPAVTWIRPRLVATVEPAAAASRRRGLPAWRLVALRDDVDPRWCVRRSPVDPPQASAHEPLHPFSPTVLSALPI